LARAKRLAPRRVEPELHLVGAALAAANGAAEEALSEVAHAREVASQLGLVFVQGEAALGEIALLGGQDPRRISMLKDELRRVAAAIRLPGEVGIEPLAVLRRIYGRLVAPDFVMQPIETNVGVEPSDGQVLTAGIPEEVFRTFVMINRSVLREKDLDRLLERLLEHAVALSGARRGFVVLLKDGRVVCEARSGELEPENEEISRGIVLEAIQQMRPLVTANAKSDTRLSGRKSIEKFDLRSVLCVPFRCYSGTEGAIYVDNPMREGVFGNRAVDFLEALASQAAIAIGNIERSREIERLNEELKQRVAVREAELDQARRELVKTGAADGARRMIAQADSMKLVIDLARRVAKSDLPVLVLGESGSGKEMIARFVHEASARCARSFVAENCSAIPETLLESEFFGCMKGAFTGADQDRDGLFQQADGGTLFLDEIGDMPLSLQSKLLRVLQEKAVRKVGATHTTPVDVRLVCATHRDLEAMVAEGKFREDLYYRVRGVVLRIPPLRERRDDIPALAELVLDRLNTRHGTKKRLGKPLLKKLLSHDWPGNVRELESEVTRLYHVASDDELNDSEFEPRRHEMTVDAESAVIAVRPMHEIERDAIRLALRETGGNREEAARRLGISRAAFYVKLKAYGLRESSPSSRQRKS
jgi:serine/threonine-protein kinase PknK